MARTPDRRQVLASGGACLAAWGVGRGPSAQEPGDVPPTLDRLLAAHADALPERPGAGANHYPMAAEALEALGHADAIDPSWVAGHALYAGTSTSGGAIDDPAGALGAYARFGDWLDLFRDALAQEPWRAVLAAWVPRLAPGLAAGAFHGLIRTAHAARALRRSGSEPRRHELAVGLAYWAARYAELPTREAAADGDLRTTLLGLEQPFVEDRADVPFDGVVERLTSAPLAPPVAPGDGGDPRAAVDELVREASLGLLEMLIAERHRVWILHTVTAPAAAGLLLEDLDGPGARTLVAHARRAVVATYAAFGEPYEPGAHLRAAPPEWPELVERAVASGYVHTIKLVEALHRYRHVDDRLGRSVAVQFLEWT